MNRLLLFVVLALLSSEKVFADNSSVAERATLSVVPTLTLIDANTKAPIPGFDPIVDGTTINLSQIDTRNLNFRLNAPKRAFGLVRFKLNGRLTNSDVKAPFLMLEPVPPKKGSKRKTKSKGRPVQPIWIATVGAHNLVVTPYKKKNGRFKAQRAVKLSVQVIDEFIEDPAAPPLNRYQEWQEHMLTFGEKHCNQQTINEASTWEGGVWYFDGGRVYHQIAKYTKDPKWEICADYVKQIYRTYVIDAQGLIPGWRVFADGLYDDYLKTNDPASKEALKLLASSSAYAKSGGGASYELSRETANIIDAYIVAEQIGVPLDPTSLKQAVDFALGHLDQWIGSQTATWVQPYLVGITLEALIRYYERTLDSRIPPAIRSAVDWLWDNSWNANEGSFAYIICRPGTVNIECSTPESSNPADLNLLIAPAFAWLYKETKEQKYLERGDAIFASGVDLAFLFAGKQFSQNYRWSFDYVKWRLG